MSKQAVKPTGKGVAGAGAGVLEGMLLGRGLLGTGAGLVVVWAAGAGLEASLALRETMS